MAEEREIAIALSPTQVEHVIRVASSASGGAVSNLLAAALENAHAGGQRARDGRDWLREASQLALDRALSDPQLSQSLLRGLAILSCYGPERRWRAIIDLARELDMSPSTTHRYVKTLRAVGLLEQHPTTREYRPVLV